MDRTGGEFHRYIRLYPILISFYPTESDIFLHCLLGDLSLVGDELKNVLGPGSWVLQHQKMAAPAQFNQPT